MKSQSFLLREGFSNSPLAECAHDVCCFFMFFQKIQNTLFFHQGYGAMKSCAPRNCYYQSAESIIEVTRDEIKRCLSEQWVVTDRCINASGVFLERLVCVHNMVGLAYLIIQEGELIFVPYRMYLLACVCGAFACAG